MEPSARSTEPAGRAWGQLLASGSAMVLFVWFIILCEFFFLGGGTFINSPWSQSVLSTGFRVQFVFRVSHLCRSSTGVGVPGPGVGGGREGRI